MKDNRKNRKLAFIKAKNNLRLGITKFYCINKVYGCSKIGDVEYWENLIEIARKSLFKTYRLKLRIQKIIPNQYEGDDFVKNKYTNVVELSNIKQKPTRGKSRMLDLIEEIKNYKAND